MARSVTVQNMLDRATKYADMVHSDFYSTQEKVDLLNGIYPELYDMLVSADENYYVAPYYTFAVSNATQAYALPADFYKIIGVDFNIGGLWVTLYNYNEGDRNRFFNPANLPTGSVRVRYIPAPPTFSSDALTTTVDGVSGWDEYVVVSLAIAMLGAEESSTTVLERRLAKLEKRIEIMSKNRDEGLPGTVTDVTNATYHHYWNSIGALRYRLYGNNIEFISVEMIGVSPG